MNTVKVIYQGRPRNEGEQTLLTLHQQVVVPLKGDNVVISGVTWIVHRRTFMTEAGHTAVYLYLVRDAA